VEKDKSDKQDNGLVGFFEECTMPARASNAQRMSQVVILQVQTGPLKHL